MLLCVIVHGPYLPVLPGAITENWYLAWGMPLAPWRLRDRGQVLPYGAAGMSTGICMEVVNSHAQPVLRDGNGASRNRPVTG